MTRADDIMAELNSRGLAIAIERRAEALEKRRAEERLDAYEFITHDEQEHDCIFDEPCSRWYDPLPLGETMPDRTFYEGTGIGALYGYPADPGLIASTAGWNIGRPA